MHHKCKPIFSFMKTVLLALLIILSPLCFSQTNVFIVTLENGVPKIEKETIAKDETKVYICGGNSDILTLVFPSGTGLSGDFVKLADKKVLVVRNVNDELVFSLKNEDGTLKQIISAPLNNLSKLDFRVNVISDKIKKAFKITGYETINEDNNSPVLNMFGDKIIPKENEFIITTEIKESEMGYLEGGIAKIEFTGNYFLTEVKLGDKICNFVLDLAATNSFITMKNLPAGTKTEDLVAKQYSAEGVESIDAPSAGFGGNISNLKTCTLPEIDLGTVSFKQTLFYVIDTLFKIKGKEIDGIVGTDLLQKFEGIEFAIDTAKKVDLILGKNYTKNSSGFISIPFTTANGHIFVNGKIGSSDINFIVDTGSPFSFIQTSLANKENLIGEQSINVRGADGNKIPTMNAVVNKLTLEGNVISDFETKIADSPLFNSMGLKDSGGLLGNSFLKKYSKVSFDFSKKKLLLYR